MKILIAFSAGLLSFFSPCILPIVPSYIVYVTGVSLQGRRGCASPPSLIMNSLLFILGFSLVFIATGALAGALGQALFQFKSVMKIVGAGIIILLGLYLLGVFRLPFLDIERKINLGSKPVGCWGSFLVGVTFAAAWVPCVGPILGSILVLAGSSQTVGWGVVLLTAYSLGLAIPFFITALALNSALIYFKKLQPFMGLISRISGAFLLVVGLLMVFNRF